MDKGVVVLGAGGHAKVCVELLLSMGREVAYCIGNDASDVSTCAGIPIIIGDEQLVQLRDQGYEEVFIAIGSNALRMRLAAKATGLGYRLVNAISPRAEISRSAKLGNGIAVMAGAVINAEAVIEDLAIINTGATIDHDCRIGQAVHIAPQSALAGNVSVGAGSFLGIGSKVIPEVSIGGGVTVGAGGVVISDIPARSTAVGVPAKVIKTV
ncbi:NeuD/PglB/VioB family sugar acetyltransferase [Dyella acidiphila]|uniref:NeuD/PglB/VioB family sugar acetyltransferase n=1 Tax=Dyella acidiphila TaxID=2775866 RepID=A0ABR9G5A6_9GAMM|nr:NeuD/PglB/VioB family sugar acetyltransferase [Dyella acidiphila]MBE1159192.1 NeuD/PglB/VioB family sugar acetyltransferase [Dyella acidiphila]